jgi:purine nucleosidase
MVRPVSTPVIFDSDGGIDDAAALWHVCMSTELELLGVSVVHGNVGMDVAAANLATVLSAAGHAGVPVALGEPAALGPHPPLIPPTAIHGHDGLGDTGIARAPFSASPQTGPELLATLVNERPGEVTVIAVGPLSNLAATLRRDPTWGERVGRLVLMGGSALRGGNSRPAAEANIAHDPQAAHEVLSAPWARAPIMVGLDVTYKATLTQAEFDLLGERRTPAADFLSGPMAFYRVVGSGLSDDGGCPCHDLLATLVAEDESIVTLERLPVAVDLGQSAAWGATVVDMRGAILARNGRAGPEASPAQGQAAHVEVALDVDVRRFRASARRLFGEGALGSTARVQAPSA